MSLDYSPEGAAVRALGAAPPSVQVRAQEVQAALRDAHAHHEIHGGLLLIC